MYKVSDLTEKLGVARSTINDWLKSYDQFIDYKMQGKRKIYSQRTLDVLKEVSELRSSGLSSHEICEELEKRHPLNGEIHEQQDIANNNNDKNNDSNSKITAPALFNKESLALMNKEQTEQLVAIINDRLQGVTTIKENLNNRLDSIDERLDKIDLMDKVEIKKSSAAPYFFLLIVVIAIIGAGAFFTIKQFQKLSQERIALEKRNSELATTTENMNKEISKVGVQLKNAQQANIETKEEYKKKLNKQRQELKQEISRLKDEAQKNNDLSKEYQAQIMELRNELAKQQKILTEKIIEANKANFANAKEAEKTNQIISKQSQINDQLTDKINKLIKKLETVKNNQAVNSKSVKKEKNVTANTQK